MIWLRRETKSKHIDWTLGLKGDHQVWPWPWRWPWIFKVKYGICYISTKSGLIATKRKANILIELLASNVTIRFDLGHDLDLEFSRSNMEFAISKPEIIWLPRTKSKHIDWTPGLKCDQWVWLIGYMTFMNSIFVKPISNFHHNTDMQNFSSKWSLSQAELFVYFHWYALHELTMAM